MYTYTYNCLHLYKYLKITNQATHQIDINFKYTINLKIQLFKT